MNIYTHIYLLSLNVSFREKNPIIITSSYFTNRSEEEEEEEEKQIGMNYISI